MITHDAPKTKSGLIQMIKMGMSNRHRWVKRENQWIVFESGRNVSSVINQNSIVGIVSDDSCFITKTTPCNIKRFSTAVKRTFSDEKL